MKSLSKSAGVTLLEVMLVLAIASMIIIMSVRYYQSASSSQQATAAFAQIQAITAAADTLAQMSGDYTQASINTGVPNLIGANGTLLSPWNTSVTVAAASASTYTVTITSMPGAVCSIIKAQMSANPAHYSSSTTCTSAPGNYVYTYTR